MVAGAMPVSSATSLIAMPFTRCSMIFRHGVQASSALNPRYGPLHTRDRIPGALAAVPGAMTTDPTLVTGATGYVGGRLVAELLRRGRSVRALTRDPARAELPAPVDVRGGDAVSGRGLREALDGCGSAYYL